MAKEKRTTHNQPTVPRSIRVPKDLHDSIQAEADRDFGGDFTAAMIRRLYRAAEYWDFEDKILRDARRRALKTAEAEPLDSK